METFKKILRTAIGFPVVILIWPLAVIWVTIVIIVQTIYWAIHNELETDMEDVIDWTLQGFILPVRWVLSIWRDK